MGAKAKLSANSSFASRQGKCEGRVNDDEIFGNVFKLLQFPSYNRNQKLGK